MQFKTKCFDHQLELFNKIKDLNYYAIFHEMGCGKTKIAIDVLRYKCYQEKRVLRTLIITPKIALHNWKHEFKVHSSMEKYVEVLEGTKSQRLKGLKSPSKHIFIINFEGVATIYKELLQKWDMIIVDESQRIKNYKANQSKAVVQLGLLSTNRLILSGTPVLNTPIDIFNQYLFLDRGKLFGKSFFSFRNCYFSQINIQSGAGRVFPKFSIKKHLFEDMKNKIMSIADNRKTTECLDLPERTYQKMYLDMEKDQEKAYKDILKDLITVYTEDPSQAMIAGTAATKLIRLRQISAGFMKMDETGKEVRFKKNPKLEAVKEILEIISADSKLIIWCWFRNNIHLLEEELSKYNPAVIYGDTKDRHEQQLKFQNDSKCRVMIANQRSAGIAINMVEAAYSLYFSQDHNYEYRSQSEARNYRSGSEIHKHIFVIDLVYAKTVDESILKALDTKKGMADSLITRDMIRELVEEINF